MTDVSRMIPIHTSLAALDVLTEAQRERIATLAEGFKANSVSVYTDPWGYEGNKNVTFCLFPHSDCSGSSIINGLIEPDGRAHT